MDKNYGINLLMFLEQMEESGELKNNSFKFHGEFWDIFREVFHIVKDKKDPHLTKLLLDLESKNVEYFNNLKRDYFTYGVLGYMAHEKADELNEF